MSGFDPDREAGERYVWRRWFGRGVRQPGHAEPRLRGGGEPVGTEPAPSPVYVGHHARSVLRKIELGE